jgi:hypothetical protein
MSLITIEGKFGIKATILADSISSAGIRLITYEIEYPRLILAELNTHRMLSKNSFSSRAVPFKKMLENLNGKPARFGANQAGMQDSGEHGATLRFNDMDQYANDVQYDCTPEEAWDQAKQAAIVHAKAFSDAGYHKQVFNRLLEPWQMMKTVISGTEWENMFWLRNHDAADPSFHELARVMFEAREQSTPELLLPGQWHLPYIGGRVTTEGKPDMYADLDEVGDLIELFTLEQAIKVSTARCAAVSYRNEDYDLAKSEDVYGRLVGADRKHASAFEHCGTPISPEQYEVLGNGLVLNVPEWPPSWEPGVTHMDKNKQLWSGNLRGYVQYRKLIPGENYEG